jgi:valyl-tRNA synthetase
VNSLDRDLSKTYDPKKIENKIYEFWEKHRFFESKINKSKKKYTIAMPPPNVTGRLHMGHALDNTLQDVLIRFKRMKGYEALWVPGTDHAALATEVKIIEQMHKEGIKKEELGRDGFLTRAWKWKEDFGNAITNQIRKMGASCDWSKECFTMDEKCSRAVREFFVRMYEKNLIYRGEKIINWCPHCRTSISDIEVDFKECDGKLWYIRYRISDENRFVNIATTRPETLLGDTALAVNPNDERYKDLVGKMAVVPLIGRKIPIAKDDYVEMDFGTGIVKITPAHDPNDFEVGLRHNLDVIKIMDDRAFMNENAGRYAGLERYEARDKIVKDLEVAGDLVKTEEIKHNVGMCYRCSEVIEPAVSTQWFVKMKPLAQPAVELVKDKKVRFIPERFDKIYYHWMENVKDWCISRQIWWGHRIPAWYCENCGEINVSRETVTKCSKCASDKLHQDEDTLDTWFSSALWPFSIFGWPDKTPELDYYFPTDTLVTGYDIIFFWVSRMIFSSKELTGKEPFKNVLIHGLVRDSKGRKMSKSLGNGVDPIEIIEKYGADALRFALVTGNSPGNDMRFSDEKVMSSRSFANKIWNSARFIHLNTDEYDIKNIIPESRDSIENWILSRLNKVTKEVNENIEKFEIGVALQRLYDFIWDEFCDWYIEFSKIRLREKNDYSKIIMETLVYVLSNILKLLHPFMPFITEEIWRSFPQSGPSIMVSAYPEYINELENSVSEKEIGAIMEIIRAIRNRRSEMKIPKEKRPSVYLIPNKDIDLENYAHLIKNLTYCGEIIFNETIKGENFVNIITDFAKIYIPMDELIDKDKEMKRLTNELKEAEERLNRTMQQLSNEDFVQRAPEAVVQKTKETENALKKKIEELNNAIKMIN